MFSNLAGEFKQYSEGLMDRTLDQLEVSLRNLRKPKYRNMSRGDAKTAIMAVIAEKKKLAVI